MKRYLGLTALILTVAATVGAQETSGPRVVVPSSNASQPRLVKVTTVNASISVHTHPGTEVIVESEGGRNRRPERTPEGLHRIDLPRDMTVTREGDVINVKGPINGGPIALTVPVNVSLQLKSVSGSIHVDGVHGEVDASTTNASVDVTNVSGTVVADTTNGSIRASMDQVDPSKPISFSSVNGSIHVALPSTLKANVKLRTTNGSAWSDFEMKMNGGLNLPRGGTITGTINGGGVEATFTTLNGRIEIRKK